VLRLGRAAAAIVTGREHREQRHRSSEHDPHLPQSSPKKPRATIVLSIVAR
jgi:hypothetical protein